MEDFGPELGLRTKRFALVAEDGKVVHLGVDEGLNDLDKASVQATLQYLDPGSPVVTDDDGSASANLVLAGAVILALVVVSGMFNEGQGMLQFGYSS